MSNSPNLVQGDTNNWADCFVFDQATHVIARVNITWNGKQCNNHGLQVRISDDGRYAVFYTWATNVVPNDTNGWPDTFVRDLWTGEVTRVTVASDGTQGDNGAAYFAITPDARFIAFDSHATNMVERDTNGWSDVFVHDRLTHTTERASLAWDGSQGDYPSAHTSISADGRFVAFTSQARNLVPGDTNNREDVFVRDRGAAQTIRVSVSSSGEQGNSESGWNGPVISADGRFVAFGSGASNLVEGDANREYDVFIHDLWTRQTELVSLRSDGSQGNGDMPAISRDGRYVAFFAIARMAPEDTNNVGDIYVRDRLMRTTRLVSRATGGWVGDKVSAWPVISGDGRFIGFESDATNLVPNDDNARRDVFVHVWRPGLGSGR